MQATREIYSQLALHRHIKPKSGSSLDQYCQFLGLACANMYLQLSRPVAQSRAYLSMAVAAQREQRFAMASTYRLALAYEKLLAGDAALLDESISIHAAIEHQLSASKLASYGLRLGAFRPAARSIARPDTNAWIGLDIGMHQIFNNQFLTGREHDVLSGLLAGSSNKEIARNLNLSEVTIKHHLKSLRSKLGARNRTHAVSRAIELGIS